MGKVVGGLTAGHVSQRFKPGQATVAEAIEPIQVVDDGPEPIAPPAQHPVSQPPIQEQVSPSGMTTPPVAQGQPPMAQPPQASPSTVPPVATPTAMPPVQPPAQPPMGQPPATQLPPIDDTAAAQAFCQELNRLNQACGGMMDVFTALFAQYLPQGGGCSKVPAEHRDAFLASATEAAKKVALTRGIQM